MIKYTLANALTSHSVPAVVKAIKGLGIIGFDKFGEKRSEARDKAVIEHALNLVSEYIEHQKHWFSEQSNNWTLEHGEDGIYHCSAPSDIFDDDHFSDYHNMGWELEPDFIYTDPVLAKTDARQYRNQQILIAALCQKHDEIDYKEKRAVANIKRLVERLGRTMDEDTVLKYLKELPVALGEKQSE